MKREIVVFGNYYYDFLKKLSENERTKIARAFLLFEYEEKMPYHYIKHLRDGIYEFRVSYGNNAFRIFFIYDGMTTIVVLFNGFRKKTQKAPSREIERAIRLKTEYYECRKE